MSMWQATCTSPRIAGSLLVLPIHFAYQADEKQGNDSVRWRR